MTCLVAKQIFRIGMAMLAIFLTLGVKVAAFSPPAEIVGQCAATCVYEKGSGYPCPYTPTYPVWFRPNGSFHWAAPHRDGTTVEIGDGAILSHVNETRHANGHWQAQWSGGNHLLSGGILHHVSHCACYYAKGIGMGQSWYLSNYGIATIEHSAEMPVGAVCEPYFAKTRCPESNASAFELWGAPWIESYIGCEPYAEDSDAFSVIFV